MVGEVMKDLSRVLDLFDRLEVQRHQIEQWRSELALANKRAGDAEAKLSEALATNQKGFAELDEARREIIDQAQTIAAQETRLAELEGAVVAMRGDFEFAEKENAELRDLNNRLAEVENNLALVRMERDVLLKNAADAIRDPGIPTTGELERLRRMEAALSVLPHPRGWSSDRIVDSIIEAGDHMCAQMKDSGLAEDWEAARGLR